MINFTYSYEQDDRPIEERFSIKFNPITRQLMSWRDEVYSTARNIADSETRPLVVCMSGGIDSEVVARAFIDQKIICSALSLRFSNGYNDHDIQYAIKFCANNGIDHEIIDLDIHDFFSNQIERLINSGYRAYGVFRYLQLILLEHVERQGKCAILGGGEQLYVVYKERICVIFDSGLGMPIEWCKRNHTVHYPYFYCSNPEIYAAWQHNDIVRIMCSNPDYFKSAEYGISLEKIIILHSQWTDMERRSKYDGFEAVQDIKNSKQNELRERFPDQGPMRMPVSEIRQHLLGKHTLDTINQHYLGLENRIK